MSKFLQISLITLAFIAVALSVSYAQPPGPPGGGGGPPCWPPPCNPIPIDGGLSYILFAGLALGGKKLYDLNKK